MGIRIKNINFLSQDDPVVELIAGTGVALIAAENDRGDVEITISGAGDEIATFSRSGAITAAAGTGRFLMPGPGTLVSVGAAINTPPTGQSLICDVNKNGTTVFTTQGNRPTILAGANATAAQAVPDVIAFNAGDYITVDVDQVGSGTAGSDLVVQVTYNLA